MSQKHLHLARACWSHDRPACLRSSRLATEDREQKRISARQRCAALEEELRLIGIQKARVEQQLELLRNPAPLATAPSQLKGRSAAKNVAGAHPTYTF